MGYKSLTLIFSLLLLTNNLAAKETGTLYLKKVKGKIGWFKSGDEKKHWKYEGEIKKGRPNGIGVLSRRSVKYSGEIMTFKVARSNPDILSSHNLRSNPNSFRIAIAISKKVSKKAVDRNKIRRIIQGWLLTNIQKINTHKPYWLLVNLKFGNFCNDTNIILEEFQNLMFKSHLIK